MSDPTQDIVCRLCDTRNPPMTTACVGCGGNPSAAYDEPAFVRGGNPNPGDDEPAFVRGEPDPRFQPAFSGVLRQDFAIGRVLSQSLSIWVKNLVPFLLLGILCYLPLGLYTHSITSDGWLTDEDLGAWHLALSLGSMAIGWLLTAMVLWGIVEQLRGRRAGIGKTITMGLRRFPASILVGLLVGLLTGLASLALIIPGIIVSTMLWVAVPASVAERPGIRGALRRSAALTKGYRFHIFGILVLLGLAGFFVEIVLRLTYASAETTTFEDMRTYMYLSLAANMVFSTFHAVAAGVGYYELRRTKEETDIEEIASVFD